MKALFFAVAISSVLLMTPSFSIAQNAAADPQIDKYINLLRKDVRSGKKQIVAANLVLTDVEAQNFWPIYERYTREQETTYGERVALIKEYAASYDTLTDQQASSLNKRSLKIDAAIAGLRQRYEPMFAKVLGGKAEAVFFQLDKRLSMLIDLQLASGIPLVEQ